MKTTPSEITQLTIASRESALAMWQAEHIQRQLQSLYPQLTVDILGMTTEGDRILDTPLSRIGGKGLFIKELEVALADGRADIAVHSMKDVPMALPDGFTLAVIGEREDPRDAFVSNRFRCLEDLPGGSVVGTSSLRRQSQLQARFPHLTVRSLRGNVYTRLRKLDEDHYAAIILAAAGLKRLNLAARITAHLSPEESLPAVGQGALGIECLAEQPALLALLAPLHHADTAACVLAERAMSRALNGSCQVPLGGFAQLIDGKMQMHGFVGLPDGRKILRASGENSPAAAETLGRQIAEDLIRQGAADILAAQA